MPQRRIFDDGGAPRRIRLEISSTFDNRPRFETVKISGPDADGDLAIHFEESDASLYLDKESLGDFITQLQRFYSEM